MKSFANATNIVQAKFQHSMIKHRSDLQISTDSQVHLSVVIDGLSCLICIPPPPLILANILQCPSPRLRPIFR